MNADASGVVPSTPQKGADCNDVVEKAAHLHEHGMQLLIGIRTYT